MLKRGHGHARAISDEAEQGRAKLLYGCSRTPLIRRPPQPRPRTVWTNRTAKATPGYCRDEAPATAGVRACMKHLAQRAESY